MEDVPGKGEEPREDEIEDLEAPAEAQSDVAGGMPCEGNTCGGGVTWVCSGCTQVTRTV